MGDNKAFFDADCSIADETNIKEKEASGMETSPNNDNTKLENENKCENCHMNESKEQGNVIENESCNENIMNVVNNTDNNMAAKNIVGDEPSNYSQRTHQRGVILEIQKKESSKKAFQRKQEVSLC